MLADSVRSQTKQIFDNIEILFEAIGDAEFASVKGGFPTWKQFYHLVHSLDKNLVDPGNYTEPAFHGKNMDILFMDTEPSLNKAELAACYRTVKRKVQAYFDSLTDAALAEVVAFRDLKVTRLELILAQLRHVFFHVGYIHCWVKIETGSTPEYVGLYAARPEA